MDQLPFGIGTPIGWVVNTLNSIWGNDHELETVARVNNRSYHGYWFLLPSSSKHLLISLSSQPRNTWSKDADRVVFEVAPVIIVSTTVMVFAFVPFGPHICLANPDLSLLFMMAIFRVAPSSLLCWMGFKQQIYLDRGNEVNYS